MPLYFKTFFIIDKFILNFLKGYMVFFFFFLHSKYSNLFMKISKNSIVNIYSKNKKVDYVFKKIHKNVFKFLSNEISGLLLISRLISFFRKSFAALIICWCFFLNNGY